MAPTDDAEVPAAMMPTDAEAPVMAPAKTSAKRRKKPTAGTPEAYAELLESNNTLKARNAELEKQGKKRKKRPPNAYQALWSTEYQPEVDRAKSQEALSTTKFLNSDGSAEAPHLMRYSRQYGPTMNTSPHPKNGEALDKADRAVFMKNVAIRAKARRRELSRNTTTSDDNRNVDSGDE